MFTFVASIGVNPNISLLIKFVDFLNIDTSFWSKFDVFLDVRFHTNLLFSVLCFLHWLIISSYKHKKFFPLSPMCIWSTAMIGGENISFQPPWVLFIFVRLPRGQVKVWSPFTLANSLQNNTCPVK